MCGLLAVINGKSGYDIDTRNFIKQGLIVGMVRGEDSTGMFQIDSKGVCKTIKGALDGHAFAQQKKVIKIAEDADTAFATLVHHRAATHGEISFDNSHPFEHNVKGAGHIIGAHNGTVSSFARTQDGNKFDVDSDWLYYNIAKKGADEFLDHVSGAYALTWYDFHERTVNLASNGDRPLHFAFVHNKNIVLVASEMEMLWWLSVRNRLPIEQPMFVPKGEIISFKADSVLREFTKTPIKKQPVTYSSSSTYRDWPRNSYNSYDTSHYTRAPARNFEAKAIEEFGLKKNEECEFLYRTDRRVGSPGTSAYNVYGEIISSEAICMEAVISVYKEEALVNLKKASSVMVKVIGVEEFINPDTNKLDYRLICFPVAARVEEKPVDTAPSQAEQPTLADIEEDTLPLVRGPRGKEIPVTKYMELVKHGCSNCSKDLGLKDADHIGWVNNASDPLCQDCLEDITRQVYCG